MSKIIGILGGMGPFATLDFVYKILVNTPVKVEQDHLRYLLDNNPKIPSRIDALQPGNDSPAHALVQTALNLEKAGADFIVMPCHSAHYWMKNIKREISIPFYSMIECVEEYLRSNDDGGDVLLLASETTIESGLYQSAFEKISCRLVLPEWSEQNMINDLIRFIKLNPDQIGTATHELNELLKRYTKQSVHKYIGGCTEIPLISSGLISDMEFIDPTLLLARKAVFKALSDHTIHRTFSHIGNPTQLNRPHSKK